jgi:hypothetical protein
MRKFLFAITLLAALGASAVAQDAKAKAEQVIKQARAAIGDESKWKNLQGLTASGTSRQSMGERQMESEIQIDVLMPDKIMRATNSQFGSTINTLNGEQLWSDFVPAVGMGGGGFGGGPRMVTMGPGGPGGAGGADNPMVKYFQQTQRRDLVLITLAWFLTAPAGVEFTYLAEAPGPEGSKLDALSAKDAKGLDATLFFDQKTHQLIGIRYKTKQLGRGGIGGGRGGQGGGQGGQRQPGGQGGQGGQRQPGAQGGQPGQPGQRPEMTPEERERRAKEMMDAFDKAPEVTFDWAFSDYKGVGGLNLPHRMTRSQGGTPNEEWEISKYKLNPKLSADKFVKKEKAQ